MNELDGILGTLIQEWIEKHGAYVTLELLKQHTNLLNEACNELGTTVEMSKFEILKHLAEYLPPVDLDPDLDRARIETARSEIKEMLIALSHCHGEKNAVSAAWFLVQEITEIWDIEKEKARSDDEEQETNESKT